MKMLPNRGHLQTPIRVILGWAGVELTLSERDLYSPPFSSFRYAPRLRCCRGLVRGIAREGFPVIYVRPDDENSAAIAQR